MNTKLFAFLVIFITNFRLCQCKKLYSNYSLYELTPTNYHHAKFLKTLQDQKYIDVHFWRKSVKLHDKVQAMVSRADEEAFKERLTHFQMKARLLLPNVQEALDEQKVDDIVNSEEEMNWSTYHHPDIVTKWMQDLADAYRDVQLYSIGKSAEGREILVLDINSKARPSVIVEGGIHGNEWISVSFVTYFIQELLLTNHNKNSDLKTIAKQYRWYFIPIVNPDGYYYTHTEDRLWRKNRRPTGTNTIGVDLNRNFDLSFGEFSTSKNPDDDYYCGPEALSEPESKALADFVTNTSSNLKFYFSIHSYGQNILIPYANTVMHMGNYESMANYAKQAAAKIFSLYGMKYEVGTNYDIFGVKSSGSSSSWVKQQFKTEYVFVISLRDNGTYGYALPNNQVLESCDEALVGTIQIMKASIKKVLRTHLGTYTVANHAHRIRENLPLLTIVVMNLCC